MLGDDTDITDRISSGNNNNNNFAYLYESKSSSGTDDEEYSVYPNISLGDCSYHEPLDVAKLR